MVVMNTLLENCRTLRRDEFLEDDHPRDESGKFSSVGGSAEHAMALATMSELKPAYRARSFETSGLGAYHPDNPIMKRLIDLGHVTVNKSGAMQTSRHVKELLKTISTSDLPKNHPFNSEVNRSMHFRTS